MQNIKKLNIFFIVYIQCRHSFGDVCFKSTLSFKTYATRTCKTYCEPFINISVKPATPSPDIQSTEAEVENELISLGRKFHERVN